MAFRRSVLRALATCATLLGLHFLPVGNGASRAPSGRKEAAANEDLKWTTPTVVGLREAGTPPEARFEALGVAIDARARVHLLWADVPCMRSDTACPEPRVLPPIQHRMLEGDGWRVLEALVPLETPVSELVARPDGEDGLCLFWGEEQDPERLYLRRWQAGQWEDVELVSDRKAEPTG